MNGTCADRSTFEQRLDAMALIENDELGSTPDSIVAWAKERWSPTQMNANNFMEVFGMAIGPSEAEPFWTSFLRSLTRRGLRGVKLVISTVTRAEGGCSESLKATWQRCRVHFIRNALAHAGKGQRQMVLAMINTVFAQETQETAIVQWRVVVDQLRAKFPKLAELMDRAEQDVLALMSFRARVQPNQNSRLEHVRTRDL